MANWCSVQMPAGYAPGGTYAGGVYGWQAESAPGSPGAFYAAARAASSTPFIFDADVYKITCSAFPNAGGGPDPLISQAAQISTLNSTVASMQSTMASILSGQGNNPWSTADQMQMFALVLGALVVVWLATYIKRFFWRGSYGE